MKVLNFTKAILICGLSFIAGSARAQLTNCNVFLKGNYVEVGININGAFGSSEAAPPGYHERGGVSMRNTCTTGCSGTSGLGWVADPARDGWTVGTPAYFGDYFLPGSPQEGWSLQVRGAQSNAWNDNATCSVGSLFTGSLTGSNVSYTTNGVTSRGTWQGRNADSIEITQVTKLDTNDLFFTISVTLKNRSAFARNNVYYMRTVDPDNEVALTSNYQTINEVVYQLPNTLNATLVTATGLTYSQAFLGLGTLDCRAKCFYLVSGLTPSVNCDVLYAEGASPARYSGTNTADAGIGIVFNLGSIAPGDSVTFSYAYILNTSDITRAFESTAPNWTATGDTSTGIHSIGDTASVCGSTLTTVSITNPGDYTWNWTALTGETLTTYTGPVTQVTTGSTIIGLRAIGTGSCSGLPDTLIVYINPSRPTPVTPTASSNSPICAGDTLSLTSSTSTSGVTYDWTGPAAFTSTQQNPNILGATTAATGTYSVRATLNGCTSGAATAAVTVNPSPSAITPATAVLCQGTTTTLTATGGGTWSSSNTGVATVSTAGVVTAVSAGVATISYGIGPCASTASVTVNAAPTAITSGPVSICVGASAILTNPVSGGTWTSGNTGVATVGSGTGTVIGVSAGTAVITYAIGTCFVTTTVTINTSPAAITPTTPVSVCIGSTVTLSDATGGGTWTSTVPSIATIGATSGIVTGVTSGLAAISYTIGSCAATKLVTVIAAAASISPLSSSICVGATTTLTNGTPGGSWSSSNGSVATVGSGTGIVTGISAGSVTISYSVGTSCVVTATVTVNAMPAAIAPSTALVICAGTTSALTNATSGGSWSSSNTGIATVNSTGIVTGVSAGTATISYTVAGCTVTKGVTVNTAPATITPSSASVCLGTTTTLSNSVSGGTWSSGNTGVATIDGSGLVTGISLGTVTISYTIGSCTATATVTVNSNPAAITPGTPVALCVGATTTLADATGGGTWSSSNTGIATVNSSGVVTAVASGTATISYTMGSGCAATKDITVSATPTAISPVSTTICVGNTTTFTNGTGGGTWTSSNTAIATIGATTGLATGVTTGNVTITYATGSCQATATLTVSPAATAGTITGPSTVCAGSTITLSNATTGGTWSSSNTAIATVSSTGVVTGTGGGIATISYSVTNVCGTVSATATVNVVATGVTPIVGLSTICAGMITTYTNTTPGGTWSSSNATATITSTGLLTAISPGTDTITYAGTNVCGTFSVTKVITIGAFLTAGTITGPSAVCAGSTITLADLAPGGVWSSDNITVATVNTTGTVSGVSGGTATISYTVSSSCGTMAATRIVSVTAIPTAGTISGSSTLCAGMIQPYTNSVSGGVWSLTNTTIAGISISGVVTAISPGLDTIRYTVSNSCGTATTTMTISIGASLSAGTISGSNNVCAGSTITLSSTGTPGGTWSSSNTAVATVNSTGTVTGVAAGITTVSYTVSSSCGTATATYAVTVNPLPDAGTISGPTGLCTGTTTLYTTTGTGGTWSTSNSNATVTTGGNVTAVTAGTTILSYTVINGCGTTSAIQTITIGATATAGTITGSNNICTGATTTLASTISGGTWSSSNTAVATVNTSGVVSGITTGTATITYTVSGSCGTATTTHAVTVSLAPSAGTISGPATMCAGTFTLFTITGTGGTWSSTNPSAATVSSTGVVTAVGTGTTTIMYTATTGCGTASATSPLTVSPAAGAGTISGPSTICTGSAVTLTSTATGGTWSSSNTSVATVSSTGIVTGAAAGTATISYTVTNSCGTATATYTVTVTSTSTAGTISGPSSVCVGSLIMLSGSIGGGAWSASNGNATITTGGIVTGITPGTDTISYTVLGACGIASATKIITVTLLPTVGPITGPTSVCAGAATMLANGTMGGTWSTTPGHVSIGSSSGIVTGITAGTDTVTYTVSGSCGSISTTMLMTVNPLPNAGTTSGPDSVCIGSAITLVNPAAGGTWSAGNTNATVTTGGVVTGISAGTTPISYSVSNSCGTASAVKIITVVSFPASGVISGPSSVCTGSGITLSSTVPGGTWSASNGNAVIVGPGIVNGVTVGVDTIFYIVSNSCGMSSGSKIIDVNPVPVVSPITGPTNHCVGTTITLTDAVSGGVWTSSNPAVATIGVFTGIVTGVTAGTTTITYTVTNSFGCPTSVTAQDTVNTMTSLPAITGSADVCAGATTTLTNAVSGGIWSSANPSVANVGATSGIVSGVTTGSTMITYTVTNSCGTSEATHAIAVNPLPTVAGIMGITHQCEGASTTLTAATTGGVWSSANPAIATVGSATGIVTGITAGITTINYIYTGAFGCTVVIFTPDTVVASPTVAAITGTAAECVGSTTTLGSATTGGVWSSANPAIATVDPVSGIVTGLAAGTVAINYSVTNTAGCTTTVSITNTVNTTPTVAAITGPASVCAGATITLADATTGGTWSMSNGNATIGTGGAVTGVTAGMDTAMYAVTNGCGTTTVSYAITINPLPAAGTISGTTSLCTGATTTLTGTVTGGVWTASNSNATVGSSTGVVTGVTAGMDTIMYTVTNVCGSATTSTVVTIGALPTVSAISGPATVCKGATITMTDATAGGVWSMTNARATISSTGVVTGVNAGTDTVLYTVSNGCGSVTATKIITVTQPPTAGTITGAATVCQGSTIMLGVSGGTGGGSWTSGNTGIATVSGGLVGGISPGTASITYTVSNSCGSRSASKTVTVLSPADCGVHTGTGTLTATEISIYPNPAASVLSVESPVKVNIAILSVDGKVLITKNAATSVDVSGLANGTYLVKIYDENNALLMTTKFVKM